MNTLPEMTEDEMLLYLSQQSLAFSKKNEKLHQLVFLEHERQRLKWIEDNPPLALLR